MPPHECICRTKITKVSCGQGRRDQRMNVLVSECSSGCESGWTLYFEHSMDGDASHKHPLPFLEGNSKRVADEVEVEDEEKEQEEEEKEEEDLSMVSDASSGPPHLHEDDEEEYQDRYQEEYCPSLKCKRSSKRRRKKKKKKKKKMGDHQYHPSFVNDTISSPLINFIPSTGTTAVQSQPSLSSHQSQKTQLSHLHSIFLIFFFYVHGIQYGSMNIFHS
ncbi:hypothetical protein SAY86_017842 [Trapa natans]|uniref:Uncharacterized protein n=1 Tax=Trapa natans TaxID=22666 RepID=A0AAN7M2H5_TRANT|nr:hypothetical protein SAY86_017842 [Trapa natans]